ncbi:hypothetical protein [Nitrospira sp. Kam-Ns4a]
MTRDPVRALIGLALLPVMVMGCAAGVEPRAAAPDSVRSQSPSEKAFQYRRQAAELSDMAGRFKREAEWYAQRGDRYAEEVRHKRDLARELRARAAEAEIRAREYREQVPHNQVY